MDKLPDPATLRSFEHAAAGHDGVLTDEDHTIVVKPCTDAEIAFYESVNAKHPQLAYYMPRFMGTLTLDTSRNNPAMNPETISSPTSKLAGKTDRGPTTPTLSSPSTSRPAIPDPLRLKGKALTTDTCIVLSAITAGFKRPNVLDLKLGARLWADDAPPAKRARLDKVSSETTSGPLGFRIAGMRVWKGDSQDHNANNGTDGGAEELGDPSTVSVDQETNYLVYNKLYGRAVKPDQIVDGFKNYFIVRSVGVTKDHALRLIRHMRDEIVEVTEELSRLESRMYSSSILLVYEGDPEAYQEALTDEESRWSKLVKHSTNDHGPDGQADEGLDEVEDEEEDEDEEENAPKSTYAVKMIDFAHSTWVPGQGPDENVLHGLRSIVKVLDDLKQSLQES